MISLNYRDARPIYEQVRDGLRHLIISGAIEADEKLPSVRSLAATLSINPNTIQRAYEALASEGYLRSEAGKGCFAAPQGTQDDTRKASLLRRFDETVSELKFLGLSLEEIHTRLKEVYQ